MFITFEGGEGSGKSTQAKKIAQYLTTLGREVVWTREPGGSPSAELIRGLLVQGDANRWDPITEVMLFTAARRRHLQETILPALEAGKTVICDRFLDSTIAYQGTRSVDKSLIEALHAQFCFNTMPDLTLLLDIDPTIGLARAHNRMQGQVVQDDRFEGMGLALHEQIRRSFLEQSTLAPHRYRVLSADGTEDDVYDACKNTIDRFLNV